MKILIYNWNFITRHDIYNTLKKMSISYELFNSNFAPRKKKQRKDFREELDKKLEESDYDAIFSINFFPDLSASAHEKNILYICWTYDSPNIPNDPTLKLDTNRIFIFDSSEYESLKERNIKNIYYLPLAVDTDRLSKIVVPPILRIKYNADLSFIGQLYQSDMDKIYPLFDEYSAGYIAGIINTQLNEHECQFLDDLINENLINQMVNEEVTEALKDNLTNGFFSEVNEIQSTQLISFLLKAITNKERVLSLSLLSKHIHVKYYGRGEDVLPGIVNDGPVDYNFSAPMVFKSSKLNLNSTLRNIKTGIPQRVLDIIGCNALAITNYQKDLDEYFSDGNNIIIYRSIEELVEKSKFYIKNYSIAEKIKQKSYETVDNYFTYEERIRKIFEICNLK